MAEGILRKINPGLEIFSAGTRPEIKVNPHAVTVMKEIGIDLSGHNPKHVDLFVGEPLVDFLLFGALQGNESARTCRSHTFA